MNFRKIISIIICFISLINSESECEKYSKLKIKDVASIRPSDLPHEFSFEAFKVVDEFIRKTIDLNYEIVLFFDYVTGEILRCAIGGKTTVELKFEDNEFNGKHVASIHNHTKDMHTPPSDKNFGILLRSFEDYELIAGWNGLWILEGKLTDEKLNFERNIISKSLFDLAWAYSKSKTENIDDIDDICDEKYGYLLSNYINNKNINEIQLNRREYKND